MRNLRNVLAVVLSLLTVFVSMPLYGAEPTSFGTVAEAESALCTGHFAPYVWQALAKSPVKGEDKVTETPVVIELDTMEGSRFIPVPAGNHLLWQNGKPVGWPGCRNQIRSWKLLTPCPQSVPTFATLKLEGLPAKLDFNIHHDGDIRVHHDGEVKLNLVDNNKKKSHTVWFVAGGIILAGGIVALASGGHKKQGPVVTTLPPCTSLPCN